MKHLFVIFLFVFFVFGCAPTKQKVLWGTFITGQILSAGNMIWQQENGYYEINPIYGKHPPKSRVYATKIIETGFIYGATKLLPEYETYILSGVNIVCWGFIVDDRRNGISFGLNF